MQTIEYQDARIEAMPSVRAYVAEGIALKQRDTDHPQLLSAAERGMLHELEDHMLREGVVCISVGTTLLFERKLESIHPVSALDFPASTLALLAEAGISRGQRISALVGQLNANPGLLMGQELADDEHEKFQRALARLTVNGLDG